MLTRLSGQGLKKVFNRRVIFEDVSFSIRQQETLLITGPNGSGKSTLVRIIGSVLTPTSGTVSLVGERVEVRESPHFTFGLVSPYLQMYDEFTPRENLQFALAVRGLKRWFPTIQPLLEKVQLAGRLDDPVRTFSSGMRQRVKYAFALVHRPAALILDEPMANLDASGIELVKQIMREQLENGMLIVSTNDTTDVDRYDAQVELGRRPQA